MLSVHTSPLDQIGTGDAGGANVYMVELARRLAERNVEVEVFTRATSSELPPKVEIAPGVSVRHVMAGPYEPVDKGELPSHLCAFVSGVLQVEAAGTSGRYDLVHSHYWLAGQVGWLAGEHWGVPLVHSMHTMAKVKNQSLAHGDVPEPQVRLVGEEQVVSAADRVVANTEDEAAQLVSLYGADPSSVVTVHPGVNLNVFSPGRTQVSRRRLALKPDDVVLLFAGRVQPLKAPDVLVRAAAQLIAEAPDLRRRLVVAVVGGPSGSRAGELCDGTSRGLRVLASSLGVDDVIRFEPPVTQQQLADWYRAADLTIVPSYNESFGLVALESQACGTPVVAAAVGGLRTAVANGRSGLLVDGHEPDRWAHAIGGLLAAPRRRSALARGAVAHAQRFSWDETTTKMLAVYSSVCAERQARVARMCS